MNKENVKKKVDKIIRLLIYITIFSLPISIGLFNTSVALIFIFLIIKLILDPKFIKKKHEFDKEIVIFSIIVFGSIFFAYDKNRVINFIVSPYLKYIVLYFGITRLFIKKTYIIFSFKLYWISNLFSALYAIYLNYFRGVIRPAGFTHNPNRLGILMAIFVIVNYIIVLFKDNNINIFALIGIVIGGLTLVITQSRGAFLSLIIGLFIITFIKNKKVILILFLVSLVSIFFIPTEFITRLKELSNLESRNVRQRILMYKAGFEIFKNNWLFGIGINNISSAYKYFDFSYLTNNYRHFHNIILNVTVELGLVGLFSFMNLAYVFLKSFYKNYNKENIYIFIAFSVFIVVLLQNLVSLTIDGSEVGLTFVYFMALYSSIINNKFDIKKIS